MVMKRRRVIISQKAKASLLGYVTYLKKEVSPEMAEYVRKAVLAKCYELKGFSGHSKERYLENETFEYRSVTKWNYNIIYRVTEEEVIVLNIIHTSRHPEKRKDI